MESENRLTAPNGETVMNMRAAPELAAVQAVHPPLMGLARLMRMAFEGQLLMPLGEALLARAVADPSDANALMDLSVVLQLQNLRGAGVATLKEALKTQRQYELPASTGPRLRLLAIMGPGDLMANAPLPFLFEHSDIALTMLYLLPGEPLPATSDALPEHDLVFIAISDSEAARPMLEQLIPVVRGWTKPVLIAPERLLQTSRDEAFVLLQGLNGVVIPPTVALSRAQLQQLAQGETALQAVLPEAQFPLIVRPLDSHAGHGLEKVDDAAALLPYLSREPAPTFYLSPFVDYSGADGLFRKYRVVLIDGKPFAGHMGVSSHWMIHYLNAGMNESAAKRAEEEAFMRDFDSAFAQRHARALDGIYQRFGLEYLVIDCGETRDGDLLVFELDPGAVVHSMDPVDQFPYKRPAMDKVFTAFRQMLLRMANRSD